MLLASGGFGEALGESEELTDVLTASKRQKLDQKLLFGLNCTFPLFIFLNRSLLIILCVFTNVRYSKNVG